MKNDYDKAIKDLDEAIRLDPKYATARYNRAAFFFLKEDYEKATKDLDEVIRLDPKNVKAFGERAWARIKLEQYDKAVADFEQALKLEALDELHRDYARFLATCPEARYRDGKRALELAKKAIELAGKDADWEYSAALAAAYAEVGDFDRAVAEQEKVLADKSLDKEDRAKMEKRLALYKDKKPYRDDG